MQATTGQNNLNYLNSIITKDYTSLCRFCKEDDETFAQIVKECPVFTTPRLGMLGVRGGVRLAEFGPRCVLGVVLLGEVRAALEENVTEELVMGKQM